MSIIGPGNVGALNLAGSLAGSQRNNANADSIKQQGSERKFQIDRQEATAHSLEDVGETETSPERDADGRMPFAEEQGDTPQATGELVQNRDETPEPNRSVDAFGERGGALDLEA